MGGVGSRVLLFGLFLCAVVGWGPVCAFWSIFGSESECFESVFVSLLCPVGLCGFFLCLGWMVSWFCVF